MKKLKQIVLHVCWAIIGVLIYVVLLVGIGRLWHRPTVYPLYTLPFNISL